jgi:hypothetical protein
MVECGDMGSVGHQYPSIEAFRYSLLFPKSSGDKKRNTKLQEYI